MVMGSCFVSYTLQQDIFDVAAKTFIIVEISEDEGPLWSISTEEKHNHKKYILQETS